jgi:Complex I intermediate-associated protein 30 (CIA30)
MTRWLTIGVTLWLAAASSLVGGEIVVDDFDDGDLVAPAGLSWMVLSDELMGGPSRAQIRWTGLSGDRRGGLQLEGEQGAPGDGFPVTFLSTWAALAADGSPRDLSTYSGLRVRARAREGQFLAGVRRAGRNVSFMAPLVVGEEWADVEIPFADLRPVGPPGAAAEWAAHDLSWVGFSSVGSQPGRFRLEVDEVAFVGGATRALAPEPAEPAEPASGFRVTTAQLLDPTALAGLPWQVVAEEAAGDGTRPRLPDATALAWARGSGDTVWFRVTLASAPPEGWFGINIALDLDDDPANGMAWWGTNSAFHFDRLITAYLSLGWGEWQGALGVADAAAVATGDMSSVTREVQAAIDRPGHALLVGVPASSLPMQRSIRLIATVGSSMVNNDDLPNEGAVEVSLGAPLRW